MKRIIFVLLALIVFAMPNIALGQCSPQCCKDLRQLYQEVLRSAKYDTETAKLLHDAFVTINDLVLRVQALEKQAGSTKTKRESSDVPRNLTKPAPLDKKKAPGLPRASPPFVYSIASLMFRIFT